MTKYSAKGQRTYTSHENGSTEVEKYLSNHKCEQLHARIMEKNLITRLQLLLGRPLKEAREGVNGRVEELCHLGIRLSHGGIKGMKRFKSCDNLRARGVSDGGPNPPARLCSG